MDEYISKPINQEILNVVMSRWLLFSNDKASPAQNEKSGSNKFIPVDLALIEECTDGNPDDKKEFIRVFLRQSTEIIKILQEHCLEGECKPWTEAAHKLRGGASMMGADNLVSLSGQAQEMENSRASERQEMFEKIRAAFSEVKTFLDNAA